MNHNERDADCPVGSQADALLQAIAERGRARDLVIEAIGDLIGLKSPELERHCKRVSSFTVALARSMGVSGDQLRAIAEGAFLHDVGMIGVPDAILNKPGYLNQREALLLREHCLRGYEVVRKMPFLAEAAEIVYAHEEWYDGTGYPRGLRGEEIPFGARVFSVAHAFDAITCQRAYRPARSVAEARQEIASLSGRQFHPHAVAAFLKIRDPFWENLRREIDSQTRRFT